MFYTFIFDMNSGNSDLVSFTDVLGDEICNSQPMSLPSSTDPTPEPQSITNTTNNEANSAKFSRPLKHTGQYGDFRSVEEIDPKYRIIFTYPYFNLVQSRVIDVALHSDQSMVVCAPTGSGKTVIFEMAITQLLMELEDKNYAEDFKIIYMAPVKALCTEKLTEWYPKFTKLGLLCIEVTGDTDVDFNQIKPYRIIITTPEKWDMLTRRWRDHRALVEVIKLFLIDEVHILNDEIRGPVLEAVVSRMKTIESSAQSTHRIEQVQKEYQGIETSKTRPPSIRFVAVSATVSNPEDVATWLGSKDKPAVHYKFGDECRPVKLRRIVEGYPCAEGTSIFKFDIILNYKLWPVIQKYHDGKPTLIFCNTRKSVTLTAETLSRELTINFNPEQKTKLTTLASTIKNKKLQALVLSGVGCHHAGLLFEERLNIEQAFRNRDLPILITTTTLAMGVNLPAHLVIIKNTKQYVNGAYQEYSMSTVLQMVGRAGRPQFDTEANAVIMTTLKDKPRYQALVGGSEPLQSYLHKRLAENLNSEAALGTVCDVAQCVQWLQSTFLYVRAGADPRRYLGLSNTAPAHLISKKIEELCVKAMNGLASSGLITMDEASCIESTEAGRLMSIYYLDLETMKHIMKINGSETLERLLQIVCESNELADMHLRVDERRCLNALNRNNTAATIRFPMKGKISTRQMKLNCIIQAILGCLPIPEPSLNQEGMKIIRIAVRVCKCLVAYVTRPDLISSQPQYFSAVVNSIILAKCIAAHLWENSLYVSKQLKGIGPTFSTLLATAGKVNFMLLEESHPRDLERIMKKSPPAGNVLRKQVSLLPKYQITMMPVDESTVTLQILLLNQSYLAENLQHLTAGDNHKCYIIVGDTNNNLLLFSSFKDKDLISVYDGSITQQIKRKVISEHKITAHCISFNFVGVDVQCEYLFKSLELTCVPQDTEYICYDKETSRRKIKQTNITDVSIERKRKSNDIDITQSKEKKKRDNALIDKFKVLKKSFCLSSKEFKNDLQKSAKMSNKILNELGPTENSNNQSILEPTLEYKKYNINRNPKYDMIDATDSPIQQMVIDDTDKDEFINDDQISNMLSKIEKEICKRESNITIPKPNVNWALIKSTPSVGISQLSKNKEISTSKNVTFNKIRKAKITNKKSNYSFIDLLEKNVDLSDEEGVGDRKDNGFSNTIKNQIDNYLQTTKHGYTIADRNINELLECIEDEKNIKLNEKPSLKIQTPVSTEDCKSLNELNKKKNALEHYSEISTCKHSSKSAIEFTDIKVNVDANIPENVTKELLEIVETAKKNNMIATTPKIHNARDDVQSQNKQNEKTSVSEENQKRMCYNQNLNMKHEIELKDDNVKGKNANISETTTKELINYGDYKGNVRERAAEINTIINDRSKIVSRQNSIIVNAMNTTDTSIKERDRGEIKTKEKIKYSDYDSNMPLVLLPHGNTSSVTTNSETTYNNGTIPCSPNNVNSSEKYNYENSLVPCNNTENTLNVPNKYTQTVSFNCNLENISPLLNSMILHDPINEDTIVQNFIKENQTNSCEKILSQRESTLCNYSPNKCANDESYSSFPQQNMYDINQTSIESDSSKHWRERTRKYYFSNTKIDICTKTTQEHQVRIIRKIEVDLDVTEIKNINIANSADEMNIDKKSQITRSTVCLQKPDKCLITHSQLTNQNANKQEYIYDNKDFKKTEDKTKDSSEKHKIKVDTNMSEIDERNNLCDVESTTLRDKSSYLLKPLDIHTVISLHEATKNVREEKPTIEKDFKKAEVETKENENNKTNVTMASFESKPDKSPAKSNDRDQVENILEKYSQILRKDYVEGKTNNNITTNTITKNNVQNRITKSEMAKPKILHKITGINKVEVPFPKTFISAGARRPINTETEPKIAKSETNAADDYINNMTIYVNNSDKMVGKNNIEARELIEDLDTVSDNLSDIEKLNDFDEYPSPQPHLLHHEHFQTDYQIDHTMFNPKNLLQCIDNDDSSDIIPPPMEFCDAYSPNKSEHDNTEDEVNDVKELNSFLCDVTPKINENDKNVFDSYTKDDVNLTPSKEIETWVLSREESMESCEPYFHHNPNTHKSHTVMRQNSPKIYNMPNDLPTSRRSKIGQFKFVNKDKIKWRM